MPTYDYTCMACGHRFERFESIHDDRAKECPGCHKKKARRMLGTGAGVIFKGAGFYTTDYKRSGKGESEGSKGSEGSKESEGGKESEAKKPAKADKKEKKEEKEKK